MNYKSQMRAWAIDQLSKLSREGAIVVKDMADLFAKADLLLDYTYVASEDLESTAKDFLDLVAKADPNMARIDEFEAHLAQIKQERISRGIDKLEEIHNA